MRRRDIASTVALCGSLVLHGVLLLALALKYIYDFNRYYAYLPAPTSHSIHSHLRELDVPDETIIPELPLPKPPPPDMQDQFGEDSHKGLSVNSSPGDEPAQSRQADEEQAALSRDPGAPDASIHQPMFANDAPGGRNGPVGAAPGRPAGRIGAGPYATCHGPAGGDEK